MLQQYIQQDVDRLSSQHELGALKRKYGKWNAGNPLLAAAVHLISILISIRMLFFGGIFLFLGLFGLVCSIIFCLDYWKKYPYRHSRHFLYENGLLLIKCKDEQIIRSEAIHWRDIATIWHQSSYSDDDGSKSDTYTLSHRNGDFFGEDMVGKIDVELGQHIEHMTFPYLFSQAISTYQQGSPVFFGPLTLHTGGIEYQGKFLPWHDFSYDRLVDQPGTDKKVETLYFLEKEGQSTWLRPYWAVVSCSDVPNFVVLRKLIFSILDAPYPVSCLPLIAGKTATISYKGRLVVDASSITMHWGLNNWNNLTNTSMIKLSNNIWQATITVPAETTVLNIAFYNQSHTWDNNMNNNYNLNVSQCRS